MNLLITGSNGFIGKNLIAWLSQQPDVTLFQFDVENTRAELDAYLAQADFVFHLAGVNRPRDESEFRTGNVELTAQICDRLVELGRAVPLLLSSSTQAELDNPYGISKRQAEQVVAQYAEHSGARVIIYRLPGVFGKWCRPNYNSVVATFCYNIAHDLPITISDPAREIQLVYIDDVVEAFAAEVRGQRAEVTNQKSEVRDQKSEVSNHPASVVGHRSSVNNPSSSVLRPSSSAEYRDVTPIYRITLGQLAETIRAFRQMRQSLIIPNLSDAFTRKLYGTFVSYYDADNLGYALEQKRDARGALAEFLKSPHVGQIFISRTKPGITRGNHYHHTKAEKFMVVEGEAIIRLRQIRDQRSEVRGQEAEIIEYRVRGEDFRVIDIPPGYTHSIENVGQGELVTLFWSSEVLDPNRMDTYVMQV
jgi:UDP-2-acetamido-2,6-beta-L-arabino-hexul-4-ose reductase